MRLYLSIATINDYNYKDILSIGLVSDSGKMFCGVFTDYEKTNNTRALEMVEDTLALNYYASYDESKDTDDMILIKSTKDKVMNKLKMWIKSMANKTDSEIKIILDYSATLNQISDYVFVKMCKDYKVFEDLPINTSTVSFINLNIILAKFLEIPFDMAGAINREHFLCYINPISKLPNSRKFAPIIYQSLVMKEICEEIE